MADGLVICGIVAGLFGFSVWIERLCCRRRVADIEEVDRDSVA